MSTLAEYRDREHWSFSALNQFLNICSLQFAFDRIYKLPKAFSPVSLAFGSAFHRALEWLHLTWKDGEHPSAEDAEERFQDFWRRQMRDTPELRLDTNMTREDYEKQGRNIMAAFVRHADPDEEVVAVNEAFALLLIDSRGNVLEKPMIGEIDLIVDNQDGRQLVDWKTSARRWPKGQAEKSLQPRANASNFSYLILWLLDVVSYCRKIRLDFFIFRDQATAF